MSHSLVTYLVPAYLESQHRVQFQELGNSWPVTRLECIRIRAFHTLFRYTPPCTHARALRPRVVRKISVGYRSLETILRLSPLIFVNKFVFYYVLAEGDRGELMRVGILNLARGFELCWNSVFDLRNVQRDFWFDLIKCGSINRSMGELVKVACNKYLIHNEAFVSSL